MSNNYRQGDHYIIDDRTGFKVRASDSRKEWTGDRVHKDIWEPRHPLDLIRSRRDNMAVTDARPPPLPIFIGPLTSELTADAAAGAQTIEILSSVRMRSADRLSIILDNGDTFFTTIDDIIDATHISLTGRLPFSASAGKQIYDNTAMAPPEGF